MSAISLEVWSRRSMRFWRDKWCSEVILASYFSNLFRAAHDQEGSVPSHFGRDPWDPNIPARTKIVGNLKLTKWVFWEIWAKFKRDLMFGMRRRWLQCVLLPLAMNVAMNIVYSHVQFCLQMNEIFKSKVDLK